MVRYSSSVVAAANLLALAQALPAQPVCSVVVQVVTGHGVWVPQPDPTWGSWDPSKKPDPTTTATWGSWEEDPSKGGKPKTTTSASWSAWEEDPSKSTKKTTTTAEWSTWSEDPSKDTKTSSSTWAPWTSTSAKPTATTTTTHTGGGFYPQPTDTYSSTSSYTYTPTYTDAPTSTETPVTTVTPTTAQELTTTSSTSTTQAPAATACPYYDGTSYEKFDSVAGGGTCGSSFTVHCGARANPSSGNVQFWERHSGEIIDSLAECLQICDNNSECTAAIWTNYAGAGDQDKNHCWQTNGLPAPSVFGGSTSSYGQLSYKNGNSATCSEDYNTPQ